MPLLTRSVHNPLATVTLQSLNQSSTNLERNNEPLDILSDDDSDVEIVETTSRYGPVIVLDDEPESNEALKNRTTTSENPDYSLISNTSFESLDVSSIDLNNTVVNNKIIKDNTDEIILDANKKKTETSTNSEPTPERVENVATVEEEASTDLFFKDIRGNFNNNTESIALNVPLYDSVSDDSFCFDQTIQSRSQNDLMTIETIHIDDSIQFDTLIMPSPKRPSKSNKRKKSTNFDDSVVFVSETINNTPDKLPLVGKKVRSNFVQ